MGGGWLSLSCHPFLWMQYLFACSCASAAPCPEAPEVFGASIETPCAQLFARDLRTDSSLCRHVNMSHVLKTRVGEGYRDNHHK